MNSHCEEKHSIDRKIGKSIITKQWSHTQIYHKSHHYRNGTIWSLEIIAFAVFAVTIILAVAIVTLIGFDQYVFNKGRKHKAILQRVWHICNVS